MKERFLDMNKKKKRQIKKQRIKHIIILFCIIKYIYQRYNIITDDTSFLKFIYQLNRNAYKYEKKKILLFDFIDSNVCEDTNAYLIFQYYQKINNDNAYYVINQNSDLYKSLVDQNKTKNLIPVSSNFDFYKLYPILLETKILVQSYVFVNFQRIARLVKYLKFLYLCHAVNYFKKNTIKYELATLSEKKRNIIVTSPYEYNFYKKNNIYKEKAMHPGGLPRYDRLVNIKKAPSEKNCILISFTFRQYNNIIYENSFYLKRLYELLSDENLLSYLEQKNTELIYIQHHFDISRGRKIEQSSFPKIKFESQKMLSKYIEQCSLYITDISSVSFDFMFQNKPVLFYFLDIDDPFDFEEKEYMQIDYDNSIYHDNVFYDKEKLVKKIKHIVDTNFELDENLKNKYQNMFYYKSNIIQKIVNVINNIINEK